MLFFLKANLENCIGTVHLELIVVPAQIFHQIFHYPLSLNSSPAAFLQGHSRCCSKHRNDIFHVQVFASPINRFLHPLTTDANSCRLPTTGISMFSFEDLSKHASRGMPPAWLMATLTLVLLLQLQRARAAQRATSTLFSRSAPGLTEFGSHSRSCTWNQICEKKC